MINVKTSTDAELRRFLEKFEPRMRELLATPGELSQAAEDLRTLVAQCRIEQRRRYAANLTAEIGSVAA